MKGATLLVLLLSLGATLGFAQDGSNTNLTQCRDLAETGNFIGSDEVLVNDKVCKVQKVTPPSPPQARAAESHPATPSAPTVQTSTPQTQSSSVSPAAAPSSEFVGAERGSQPVPASVGPNAAPAVQKRPVVPNSPTATITFVTVRNGNVAHLMPDWAIKWVRKNEKKYPGVRFETSGEPVAGARNFVVAFSASSAEVQGFQPVTHTDTSTNTNPVSGSGTVTDTQGEMWNYSYNGTVTTTTTTTTHENVPYTISSNTLYVSAFDERGEMVAQRWHVYSTQSGGNSANSLGYNLGNALGAINARGHMLKTVVDGLVGKGK
jgi:hypothetical protein